jgi:hypothetical protein
MRESMRIYEGLMLISNRLVVAVVGFATPILLTAIGYLPFMSGLLSKLNPYLVYPSLIKGYQVQPLPYLVGNAPTIGQTLYIVFFFLLNLILAAINFK